MGGFGETRAKSQQGHVGARQDRQTRFEIHFTCQTTSLHRYHIADLGVSSKDGSFSSYSRTPMYNRDETKTPMHSYKHLWTKVSILKKKLIKNYKADTI